MTINLRDSANGTFVTSDDSSRLTEGPRAPTQEPSKDKGTYIGLKRKFSEGGRVQDWLSRFLLLSTRFLCRWYVMMTWPYPWAIEYRLRRGVLPLVRLVRLLRVNKRGVLRQHAQQQPMARMRPPGRPLLRNQVVFQMGS